MKVLAIVAAVFAALANFGCGSVGGFDGLAEEQINEEADGREDDVDRRMGQGPNYNQYYNAFAKAYTNWYKCTLAQCGKVDLLWKAVVIKRSALESALRTVVAPQVAAQLRSAVE